MVRKFIFFIVFSLTWLPTSQIIALDKKTLADMGTKVATYAQCGIQRYIQAFTHPQIRANAVDMAIYTGTALAAAVIIYSIYRHIKHNLNTDKPAADSSQPITVTTVIHNTTPVINPYQWHWTYYQPVIVEQIHTQTHTHCTHYMPEQKQVAPQPTYERTTQSIIEQTQLTPNIEQKAAEFGKIKLPSIFE